MQELENVGDSCSELLLVVQQREWTHLHVVFLDGVYAPGKSPEGDTTTTEGGLLFRALPHLSTTDVADVLQIARAAVSGLAPAGPELRRCPMELSFEGRPGVLITSPLSVREHGFSLHAATRAGAEDPQGREALLKYILHPSIATDMDPLSLLCRLAATGRPRASTPSVTRASCIAREVATTRGPENPRRTQRATPRAATEPPTRMRRKLLARRATDRGPSCFAEPSASTSRPATAAADACVFSPSLPSGTTSPASSAPERARERHANQAEPSGGSLPRSARATCSPVGLRLCSSVRQTRESFIARLAQRTSWATVAEETAAVYRRLLEPRPIEV